MLIELRSIIGWSLNGSRAHNFRSQSDDVKKFQIGSNEFIVPWGSKCNEQGHSELSTKTIS